MLHSGRRSQVSRTDTLRLATCDLRQALLYVLRYSVEVRRPLRVAVVLEQPRDLRRHSPRERQLGQRALAKEPDLAGLAAGLRRAAGQLTQEEDLVRMKRIGWVAMPIAIVEGQQLDGARDVAGLLGDLALDRLGWRVAHVGP